MLLEISGEITPERMKLLLLLLSRFSRVQLCATPWTAAYQAPLSMGFSRQEYWSGVPLPSPERSSSVQFSSVAQLCPTLRPDGLQPSRLLCSSDSPGKSIGVGCHTLIQGIVPTQGSNPGLLHCRQILYQLSRKGSHKKNPNKTKIRGTNSLSLNFI